MLQQKQMFKVLCPVKRPDGGTFWMRLGIGFRNKDNSINLHLDAIPTGECKLQIREFDEEDRRRSEARRADDASFTPRVAALQSSPSSHAADPLPF